MNSIRRRLLLILLLPLIVLLAFGVLVDYLRIADYRVVREVMFTDVLQLVVIVIFIWFGVAYGLRPLLALRDQIAARSAHDLAPLNESAVPGEVIPLTYALNRMLATLRDAAVTQQQFLANAAHQLRTPLTGIQAQLEVLEQDPAAGELGERLRRLHDACRRLAHTSNQLLALARAESSLNLAVDLQPLELRPLVEELVAANLDRAIERQIDLGVEAVPVRVQGVVWLLRELVANLVDNALIYTPLHGRVTVRCGFVDNAATPYLEVEDDGPGIAPAERAQVVKRFYRAPGSGGNGCGLGLAIVDEIARTHHAQLVLGTGAGECGTRVRVIFPSDGEKS